MASEIACGDLVDNRYQIIRKLGFGGFGSVFLVRDTDLDRQVAIKILDLCWAEDQAMTEGLRRFRKEARTLSKLEQSNIVRVFSFGVMADSRPYLVMEYLSGSSLQEYVRQQETLTFGQVQIIGAQIGQGLAYAHSQGVIHRDLKPENIIIVKDGLAELVKIIDFGLCREERGGESGLTLTETGALIGTPAFMSPEQCYGRAAGPASDIYAFGCLLFFMLTGKQPFEAPSPAEIICMKVSMPFPRLSELYPDQKAPPLLEEIIRKCCHHDPDKRFQSFNELLAEWQELKELSSEQRLPLGGSTAHTKRQFNGLGYLKMISAFCLIVSVSLFLFALCTFEGRNITAKTIYMNWPVAGLYDGIAGFFSFIESTFGSNSREMTEEGLFQDVVALSSGPNASLSDSQVSERLEFLFEYFKRRKNTKNAAELALLLFERSCKRASMAHSNGEPFSKAARQNLDAVAEFLDQNKLTKQQYSKIQMILCGKVVAPLPVRQVAGDIGDRDLVSVFKAQESRASSIINVDAIGHSLPVLRLRLKVSKPNSGSSKETLFKEYMLSHQSILSLRLDQFEALARGGPQIHADELSRILVEANKALIAAEEEDSLQYELVRALDLQIKAHLLRSYALFYRGDIAGAMAEMSIASRLGKDSASNQRRIAELNSLLRSAMR